MTDEAPRDATRTRRFVFLLGWVSLLADLCYEGMRGAIGPYLALLGASATAVGVVAGTGEAIGYALRYASGVLADRTRRYWTLAIAGYATNLIAVPLLALAGSWPMVAALVGLERLGKAIRSPAKSTIVSFAASEMGAGRVFAITEAMDQVGGLLGPLLVAGILAWRGDSPEGFAWAFVILGIPAIGAILVLLRARRLVPDPHALDRDDAAAADGHAALGPQYRTYLIGVALVAVGLADWPLLAYHMEREGVLATRWLPVAYAAAMAADGVVALLAGTTFDRMRARGGTGAGVVALFVALGAAYAPLVLLSSGATPWLAVGGIALWCVALAATESIGKAMIATIVPRGERGRAFGLYYLVWGLAWWGGSIALGALYDRSHLAASAVATGALLAGAAVVALSSRRGRR
ncbi:MAG: MFS transporter [Deltaproteobacteria bacterium]|nr:MFS transporter [Deltaproteobacteria bacterium]